VPIIHAYLFTFAVASQLDMITAIARLPSSIAEYDGAGRSGWWLLLQTIWEEIDDTERPAEEVWQS